MVFIVLIACVTASCGNGRQIEFVTVSPAVADAKNYPGGKVPFVATGHYNME